MEEIKFAKPSWDGEYLAVGGGNDSIDLVSSRVQNSPSTMQSHLLSVSIVLSPFSRCLPQSQPSASFSSSHSPSSTGFLSKRDNTTAWDSPSSTGNVLSRTRSCSLTGTLSSVSREVEAKEVEAGMKGVAGMEPDGWKGPGFELSLGPPLDWLSSSLWGLHRSQEQCQDTGRLCNYECVER
jgi:hypothetical protein